MAHKLSKYVSKELNDIQDPKLAVAELKCREAVVRVHKRESSMKNVHQSHADHHNFGR